MNNSLEEYFRQEAISYKKIKEGKQQTPDYKVFLKSNRVVIVEFKEFQSTVKDAKLNRKKISIKSEPPGLKRIRNKIKECSKQFKSFQNMSTVCVLRNTGGDFIDLSTPIITMAMLGDVYFSVRISGSRTHPPIEEGFMYGRNALSQIVRKENGSLVSAVALLEKIYLNQKKIDRILEDLFIESKKKRLDLKRIMERGFKRIEEIQNDNPDVNFDEFKWRLRIIHNPYAKVKFPIKIFGGKWNEEYIYQNNLGYKKL